MYLNLTGTKDDGKYDLHKPAWLLIRSRIHYAIIVEIA